MSRIVTINNIPPSEKDQVETDLRNDGANPVYSIPESDGEFTVIAVYES